MIRLLTKRSVQTGLLLALLLVASWLSGADIKWLQKLQYQTFDTFNKIKPRQPTDSVMIVDIDEDSLAAIGQWPWPRDLVGRLVDRLTELGAASVSFDMVFSEADRTAPSMIAKRLPKDSGMDTVRETLLNLPDNDAQFAKSIAASGRVVTGFVGTDKGNMGRTPVRTKTMTMPNAISDTLMRNAMSITHMVTNLHEIESAAQGNGSFSITPDLDGIVRRVPMVVKFTPSDGDKPRLYPSLAFEALRVAVAGKNSILVVKPREKAVIDFLKPSFLAKIGPIAIPIEEDGRIWVYYTPVKKSRYISAWRVLAGQVDPDQIKGRIIFIGTSAEGLKDIRSSPLNLFVPGVEMHVNIVEQALQGKFISRPAFASAIEAIFIFVTGLLMIVLVPFVNVFVLLAAVVALVSGAFSVSWLAYTKIGVLIDPVYPSLAVMAMFILSALLSYLKSEYERGEIRSAFGLYISPDFMTELTKHPDKLKLGGEIKELTIMFTDIRNFTTIAEGMTPEVLINTMNDFLTPMSDEVMKARGTIDKYMGDAMMAFWNAPLDVADHEKLAIRAALAMRDVLAPVNAAVKAKAEAEGRVYHPLNCGIGINTGPVAVGNMGSRQRFAYSVLGDAVNLASRLEGQTKTYGLNILIGEATALKASAFALMEIDLIKVKGKTEPVRIFTVLGDENVANTEAFKIWQGTHDAFLKAYREKYFDDALRYIRTCRGLDEADALGDYYMVFEMRISDFLRNPPPDDWDGVYTATGK